MTAAPEWPRISTLGVDGFLISFGATLSEPANRAALAFRKAVEDAGWSGVQESSTSLVSTYLRFDPMASSHTEMRALLEGLVSLKDWFAAPLPDGRKRWRIPTVYGTDLAPQLDEAAQAAGLTRDAAIASISQTCVRVQTIGFAPGQPYLGELPAEWDIPRQTNLTEKIPVGALVVAIRQLVLFSVTTPTGWRHIGQTGFRLFRPETAQPFVLRPGDEVFFDPTTPETLNRMQDDADGGATCEALK